MAPTNAPRAWRPLTVLAVLLAAMAGGIGLLGEYGPRLGLDLRGGTSITLTAQTPDGSEPTEESMRQAVDIIRARVNGTGVAEAEVTTQGSTNILVQVPDVNEEELVRLVGQTAELRFRPVRAVASGPAPAPAPTPAPTAEGTPVPAPNPSGAAADSASPAVSSSAPAVQQRAMTEGLATGATATASSPGSSTPAPPPAPPPAEGAETEDDAALRGPPTPQEQARLDALDCSTLETNTIQDPDEVLYTCDQGGTSRFLLGPADLVGTDLDNATAGIPQGDVAFAVQLEFTSAGAERFAEVTSQMANQTFPFNSFAIVLDGQVVSYPSVNEPILDGRAQITGQFSQQQAQNLATVLNYGALPLSFQTSDVSTITPTLGESHLAAGVLAGAIGLGLVLLYGLGYYRGLGLVVFASLTVAGAMTYGAIVLLGEAIGFTLTIAGVAGIIVAVGITADSFVVFFERVRDEIREGRTGRMAVETGWARARRTILASDAVSLFAAFFLYSFSIANVRGFAFALGLTTIVDLIVVFLFTKPLVSLLARSRFFGAGNRWSGLDPQRLGALRRGRGMPPATTEVTP